MTLAALLSIYGYPAIWVGTFLEGETILVLGVLAAHQGYLKLSYVILCGFAGSLMGDQLFFFLGRRHGGYVLKKRPGWRHRMARVHQLSTHYENAIILFFRFLYGLRTITPFVLGTGNVRVLKFIFLNSLGAALWASAVGTAGYLFGHAAEAILGKIKHFEKWLLLFVLAVGIIVWVFHFVRLHRNRNDSGKTMSGNKK